MTGGPQYVMLKIYRRGPLSNARNREAAMKLFATRPRRMDRAAPLPECAALSTAPLCSCTFTQRAGAIRFTSARAQRPAGSKAGKRTVFARFQTAAAVQAAPEHISEVQHAARTVYHRFLHPLQRGQPPEQQARRRGISYHHALYPAIRKAGRPRAGDRRRGHRPAIPALARLGTLWTQWSWWRTIWRCFSRTHSPARPSP